MKHEGRTVTLGSWKVMCVRDADNHLSVWVSNEDGSEVLATEADICDDACWGERFTTRTIEAVCEE